MQVLQRKREITLANQAIDEVKVFFSALHLFVHRLYQGYIHANDLRDLNEDIVKILVNTIVRDSVQKVLLYLQRIDNYEYDKDLRGKYALLKGAKTTDFGVDAYLSMQDPVVLVKEACKRYNIRGTVEEMHENSTLQKLDLEEIDSKEFFRVYKTRIEKLPQEVRSKVYSVAKVKPFH